MNVEGGKDYSDFSSFVNLVVENKNVLSNELISDCSAALRKQTLAILGSKKRVPEEHWQSLAGRIAAEVEGHGRVKKTIGKIVGLVSPARRQLMNEVREYREAKAKPKVRFNEGAAVGSVRGAWLRFEGVEALRSEIRTFVAHDTECYIDSRHGHSNLSSELKGVEFGLEARRKWLGEAKDGRVPNGRLVENVEAQIVRLEVEKEKKIDEMLRFCESHIETLLNLFEESREQHEIPSHEYFEREATKLIYNGQVDEEDKEIILSRLEVVDDPERYFQILDIITKHAIALSGRGG